MGALAAWLAIVTFIAIVTFGLLLVLARRVRSLDERFNLFFPPQDRSLPEPGMLLPHFEGHSAGGVVVSQDDFANVERVFAALTTDCASCREQVSVFRDLAPRLPVRPIVSVIGSPASRREMVESLAESVIVLEDEPRDNTAHALGISEFPAVLLVRDKVVVAAGHGLASVLSTADAEPAQDGLPQRTK